LDGHGARALFALADLILDHLALTEFLDHHTLKFRVMEEEVFAPSVNEPKSLFRHYFLDLTFLHFCAPLNMICGLRIRRLATSSTNPKNREADSYKLKWALPGSAQRRRVRHESKNGPKASKPTSFLFIVCLSRIIATDKA
jgi:hypothetical protein